VSAIQLDGKHSDKYQLHNEKFLTEMMNWSQDWCLAKWDYL